MNWLAMNALDEECTDTEEVEGKVVPRMNAQNVKVLIVTQKAGLSGRGQ